MAETSPTTDAVTATVRPQAAALQRSPSTALNLPRPQSARDAVSRTVAFKGKSGERYLFQVWPFGTKFKAVGGVYIVTSRTFEDRTFQTKASHRTLVIGQTADFANSLFTPAEWSRLAAKGGNCICVYAAPDAERRAAVETDLIEGQAEWGGSLQYLFHLPVTQKPPGPEA